MPQGYPILLDVSNRLVVIVGGGTVALRKASGLIDAGATRVRVVAPEIDARIPATAEQIREEYRTEHLEGASIAFAATNSRQVNEAVCRDGKNRGILVNQVDDAASSDFTTPAQLKRGVVTVAVSAGSPSLSVLIRDALAQHFDERWSRMAEAMQALRPAFQNDKRLSDETRQQVFRDLATDEALDVLAHEGLNGLKRWIERKARM